MSLVLTITNVQSLENGVSTQLTLDRHGAAIGRSPHADWSLPDPSRYISSTHCEIDFRDGSYILVDKSTNGTYLNGQAARLAGPHAIADGDTLLVGPYEIHASLKDGRVAAAPAAAPAWSGWESHPSSPAVEAPPTDAWGPPPQRPAISGEGPMSEHWAPPVFSPAPGLRAVEADRREAWPPSPEGPAPTEQASARDPWAEPVAPPEAPSAWSSPASAAPPAEAASDVWARLAAGNVVDWARGGFGAPAPAIAPEQLGLSKPPAKEEDAFGLGAPPVHAPAASAPAMPPGRPGGPREPDGVAGFLAGANLDAKDLSRSADETLGAAGRLLRTLVAGLVVMLEARARAKAQLGATATHYEHGGNNPLKFARTPEGALIQLLNRPERGFLDTERAVEDAFKDLQAHQMATLAAMQAALATTLARFSPQAIRERAETGGWLTSILPRGRDAALWRAYEREFEGVARDSDEAFMDVFATEFREAYERAAAEMKGKS